MNILALYYSMVTTKICYVWIALIYMCCSTWCCTGAVRHDMTYPTVNFTEQFSPSPLWRIRSVQAIRAKRTFGGLEPVWTNLQATVSFSSSIQLEMMHYASTPAGPITWWSSSNKVQRMHRYDRNCMSVWKIARNLKLAIRLKLLRPVSNSKYLGLRELLHRVRTLSSCEELLSQHFSPSWPGRVRQIME